jgi:hypothetical protein
LRAKATTRPLCWPSISIGRYSLSRYKSGFAVLDLRFWRSKCV